MRNILLPICACLALSLSLFWSAFLGSVLLSVLCWDPGYLLRFSHPLFWHWLIACAAVGSSVCCFIVWKLSK